MPPRSNLLKNKKIFEARLSITTNCTLRCKYCPVNKPEKSNMMSYKTAKAAIDFISANGRGAKILKIYGGEPILNFGLIRRIVPYIRRNAPKDADLTIALCTSAVLIKLEHIDFFRKNNLQLAISFDGRRETHDKFRRFKNGKGTFSVVVKNLKLILNEMDKRCLGVNIGIAPSEVSRLFENFKYILSLGFDTVNLEPISNFQKWQKKHQMEFEEQMEKIIKFLLKGISQGKFVFLTTINRELKYKTLSRLKKGVCLFDQFLEFYPSGEMNFSSFFFNLPPEQRRKYIIGNVIKGTIKKKYRFCRYNSGEKCRRCLADYFDIPEDSQCSKVIQKRNLLSINAANLINKKAESSQFFKKYIGEVEKHICL